MEYITAQQAADIWGITRRRVQILCAQGRIQGATKMANVWILPKNTEKPADGRRIRYKKEIEEDN